MSMQGMYKFVIDRRVILISTQGSPCANRDGVII